MIFNKKAASHVTRLTPLLMASSKFGLGRRR